MELNIDKLVESIQRSFTSKIDQVKELPYWERLKELNLFSLERRRDRYTVLYVYKIIVGLVPNFEDERFRIQTKYNERRGLLCIVPAIRTSASARIKSMVDQSFAVRGPRLFNMLPKKVRNINVKFEAFKRGLDQYLGGITDEPPIFSHPQTAAGNNSLGAQIERTWRNNL